MTRPTAILDPAGLRAALCAGALALAAGPPAAGAAETRLDQRAGVETGFSDNIDLAPDAAAEEAFYTTLTHSGAFQLDGNRLDLDLYSNLQVQAESSEGSTEIEHALRGVGNWEAVEDWLYLDVAGSSTRQLLGNDGGRSATGRVSDRDRATVSVVDVSPYVQRTLGSYARGELRLRHTEVFVTDQGQSSEEVGDRRIDEQSLAITSARRLLHRTQLRGEASHLTSEAVRGDADDGEDDSLEIYQGAVTASYAITRQIAVLATGGATEVDADDPRDLSGPLWDIGVELEGNRLSGSATVGQRYNEPRATLDATYRHSPKTSIEASLTRELGTSQGAVAALNRADIADPTTEAIFTDAFTEDLDEGVALTWRGRVQATTRIGRNTLRLGVRYADREFAQTRDTTWEGRFRWDRQLSRKWTTRLNLSARQQEENEATETLTAGVRLELARALTENSEVYVGVARTDQSSDVAADEYSENVAFIGGRLSF